MHELGTCGLGFLREQQQVLNKGQRLRSLIFLFTDQNPAEELVKMGVPREDIILTSVRVKAIL